MRLLDYEKKHILALRKSLAECMVLLRSNGDFPLYEVGKIALYGSGARHTIKGGTGSGEVNSRYFVTVEKGLKKAGFEITTNSWLDAYDAIYEQSHKDFVRSIKQKAKEQHVLAVMLGMGAVMPEPEYELPLDGEGDTAIYVLSRISGEGNDRQAIGGDILLNGTELRDIRACQKKYKNFLLVLNVGGPVDLTGLDDVENILILSQLGVETGTGLAEVITGKQNPSGKLTTTWASVEDYSSVGEFGDINDTRYKEGIYVGYRYFDTVGRKPLYPFGYGLSFTTFETKITDVTRQKDVFTVKADVKNTGAFKGKEVVQLYLSAPSTAIDRPYQELCGFAKTEEIAPGETASVEITFALSDFCAYNTAAEAYVLEAGEYILRAGNDSGNTSVCGVISLEDSITVKQVKNLCKTPDFTDWKPEDHERVPQIAEDEKEAVSSAAHFALAADDFEVVAVAYDTEDTVDEWIKTLSDETLAKVNTGAFNESMGAASVIGNASMAVAGAAGETTGILKDQGFPVMVMADGPAGLRISKDYFEDKKGVHTIGAAIPETITEFLPGIAKVFMDLTSPKPKKNQEIKHHYMTAIPIGTALAQSFNLEFAKTCGDIVGDEMERTGVHLWLAPALNIHRSIRCGRNFEYFSEDPLVSGRFAAAITNGVQQHPGCGTTIKHYAANNQETNRYTSNSQVSERAMREIYLKGFDIAVRESQPHAVMTSYNLLNGEHTAESRGLIEGILRSEFGYEGIVMTDWTVGGTIASKEAIYPNIDAGNVAAAGGDLVMPGSKGDVEKILERLKEGKLTRHQLEVNATRVYRMAKKLCNK